MRQVQVEFTRLIPRLIAQAFELGFEVTLGDAYRDPRVHGDVGVRKSYSHPRSAHKRRLAIDLNLFINGEFQEGSEAHRELGAAAARAGLSWLASFGPRSRAASEAARAGGLANGAAFHTEDVLALTAFVKDRLRPGDVLLVKGSRGMRLERLVEALR